MSGTPNTSTGGDTPTPTTPGAPEPIPPEPEIITVTKEGDNEMVNQGLAYLMQLCRGHRTNCNREGL